MKKLKTKAWSLFSQYIRRKYSDKLGYCECFTCGAVKPWKEMDAGHGIGGRGNFVLFLEEVCRPQCKSCNLKQPFGKDGNYEVFIPKLIDLYTKEQYEEWVIESRKPMKRTKADYLELIEDLKQRLEAMI